MGKTKVNLSLNSCSSFLLEGLRAKLNEKLNSSESEYPFDILSESIVDDEFLFYNFTSFSLLLSVKSSTDIKIYTDINRFVGGDTISKEILSFSSLEKYLSDSSDVDEFGTLIGDMIYNIIRPWGEVSR